MGVKIIITPIIYWRVFMQKLLSRETEIFLNFLYNCYSIPIRVVKETEKIVVYMGEIRFINGEIGVAKLEVSRENDRTIFTVYNSGKRAVYQSMNVKTEGRTKKFLDKMVYGK